MLALFGLSQRPPAAVLHRAAKRSPELRCTCSFLLLNSEHQSRRCLSTGGTRPLRALHMQPGTIDQQAAGAGAGPGPAFMCLQSGRSPRHQRNTGVFRSWKPPSLFGQVSKRLFIQGKCSGGAVGGAVGSENSLEQQEITRKHRGEQGEHSHTGSVTAAAETTKIRRVRRPHESGRNEAERSRTNGEIRTTDSEVRKHVWTCSCRNQTCK